ncbi:MAG: disulfide bond formation protein DsbA [Nitrosopumilaceae archaeon]|nr:MAG: disulfide bond formation protein DsbA [Nitrosopumilaceae archaeon]
MKKIYLVVIPIIIGVITGMVLTFYPQSEDDSKLLTESKLIQNGSPVMGNPSASITILEWGDYQCTFCHKFHQSTLNTIKHDFIETGKAKLVFKDFPLNGPDSVLASEAAYCAQDQGKYWQYHDELYKNWAGEKTGWITHDSLDKFATTTSLDLNKFNECLDDHKYLERVNQMYEFGKKIGIDATPSFLVSNNEKIIKITGNQPLEVFLKSLDEL